MSEVSIDGKKAIWVNVSDYNTMTLIAKKNGFVHPEGTQNAGKMDPCKVVEYLIRNFLEPIA
jgi:hypothetical protein